MLASVRKPSFFDVFRMFVPFHDGVISQFDGYGDLADLDWDRLRSQYGNIQRLDRILEAEHDDAEGRPVTSRTLAHAWAACTGERVWGDMPPLTASERERLFFWLLELKGTST